MNPPLVSIIIGAYNVSKYLKSDLSCLLKQTYQNIEILIIDDGSTDDTLKECERLQQLDSRIRVFHQANQGVAAARNHGLTQAFGKYIWFFDVDDTCQAKLIEKCVTWMEEKNLDLAIFGFVAKDEKTGQTEDIAYTDRLIESNEDFKHHFNEIILDAKHGNGFNWNKFYRKSFIEKHQFRFDESLRIQQDEIFNVQLYPHLERIYVSNECLYEYLFLITGNNRTRYIPTRFDIVKTIHRKLTEFAKQWGVYSAHYQYKIENRFLNGLLDIILGNTFHPNCPLTSKEKSQYIKDILNQSEVQSAITYVTNTTPATGHFKILIHLLQTKNIWGIRAYRFTINLYRKLK